MKIYFTLSLSILLTFTTQAQDLSASELLSRSMAFHDPDGKWAQTKFNLVVDMEVPGRPVRSSEIVIDNANGTFQLSYVGQGRLMQFMVDAKDSAEARLNFRKPDPVMADSLDMTADRARRWRNYYCYLYGLPMKLTDDGTNIEEEVTRTTFNNKPVLSIKVTYDQQVGSDTWYFYFNPETYAMVGYRFYHDEGKNDGEYIVLNGMSIHNGLRIPRDRTWYTNAENRLLGTDYLVSMEVEN